MNLLFFKNKKNVPNRKYHDGDIVEFDFEANSLEINWQEVKLIGVVSGVLYERDGIRYKVQMRDNRRDIFGDFIIHEKHINRKR